jgi:quinol-cytochrome oxidoreductase complex cytochrome b subunit
LGEDQALNMWLDTMDAKIDEKLDKYYGATINQTAASLPPLFAPTMIPFVAPENIIPQIQPLAKNSSKQTSNSFSSAEIIILFGILATIVFVTFGGILYHRKSKRRNHSYASLIENENVEYNQIYENDNL